MTDSATTLGLLRRVLLWILVIGMAGTTAELLLLRHTEDTAQVLPLGLLGAGYAAVGWNALRHSRISVLILQLLMVLFVASGLLGMYFHYAANLEFQLELEPELSGRGLIWKILQAKTPPALAPGIMAQLGLVGLAYAYRHPAVARRGVELEENRE